MKKNLVETVLKTINEKVYYKHGNNGLKNWYNNWIEELVDNYQGDDSTQAQKEYKANKETLNASKTFINTSEKLINKTANTIEKELNNILKSKNSQFTLKYLENELSEIILMIIENAFKNIFDNRAQIQYWN